MLIDGSARMPLFKLQAVLLHRTPVPFPALPYQDLMTQGPGCGRIQSADLGFACRFMLLMACLLSAVLSNLKTCCASPCEGFAACSHYCSIPDILTRPWRCICKAAKLKSSWRPNYQTNPTVLSIAAMLTPR